MAFNIDPQTGLPVDEQGNLVDPQVSGSMDVSEEIDMTGDQFVDPGALLDAAAEIEMLPDDDEIQMPAEDAREIQMPVESARSSSSSYRGMTDAGLKRSGGLFDRALDEAAPEMGRLGRARDASVETIQQASDDRRSALLDEAEVTKQHYARERELSDQIADLHETAFELEKQAGMEAKAEREQYLGTMREQLVGVRQLVAMSGNPLGQMTGLEAFGLAGAQGVQAMLALRGHQIDVAGQVDRWVDRGLQQHQLKIQNARQGVQDTMHLYDLARQSSQDDFEARQRMRAFVIEGMKQTLLSEAARFNSEVANSRARQEAAKLDIELENTMSVIGDRYEKQLLDVKQTAIQQATAQGQLAIQSRAQSEAARHNAEMEKIARGKAEAKAGGTWNMLADPFDRQRDEKGKSMGGGKLKWKVDTTAPEGVQSKAADRYANATQYYADMRTGLDRLRDLRGKAEKYMQGPAYLREQFPEYREYKAQRDYLTEITQKHITGAAAPDEQARRIQKWLRDDDALAFGNNAKLIENFNETLRKSHEHTMKTTPGIVPLTEEDFAGGKARYQTDTTSDPERETLFNVSNRDDKVEPAIEGVAAGAKAADRQDLAEGGQTRMFMAFQEKDPAASTMDFPRTLVSGYKQSNEMRAVDKLVLATVSPERFITGTVEGQPTEDPEEIRADAREMLQNLASGKQKVKNEQVRQYAKFALEYAAQHSWDPEILETNVAETVDRSE